MRQIAKMIHIVLAVNESSTSFVQTFDSKTCSHLDSVFLGLNVIIRLLAEDEKALEYVWLVKENDKNVSRSKNNRSAYDLVRHKPMILALAYM